MLCNAIGVGRGGGIQISINVYGPTQEESRGDCMTNLYKKVLLNVTFA